MGIRLDGVAAQAASDVVPHVADLSEEAEQLLVPAQRPAGLLDALVAARRCLDRIRFLAHGVGRREAVWWACVCNRQMLAPDTPAPALDVLAATERWCHQPTDENRRAAEAAAQASEFEHPAAFAAMAAFFSGGSLAPASVAQPVPPGPFDTARAVVASITLAALLDEPEKAPDLHRTFLLQGVEIVNAAAQQQASGGQT